MAFNVKLVVRDSYQEEIIDLVQITTQINMGNIDNDIEIVEGSKLQAGILGVGNIGIGRTASFGIPIFEAQKNGTIKRMESQYIKYTSAIMSTNIKRYFLRIEFENEIYEAEYALTSVSGYNITWIKNMGVITIELKAIDKVFFRQNVDVYTLGLDPQAKSKQDIYYNSLSYVPVPLNFYLEFELNSKYLSFTFANRQNFGIYASVQIESNHAVVYFNGEILSINGVGYDFEGIAPELQVGTNILYLEYNQSLLKAEVEYRRGILI